jgi:hypothetical protein
MARTASEPIVLDEAVVDRVYAEYQQRFSAQKKEHDARRYQDPDRVPNPLNLHCLFVYRDAGWQLLAFVGARPSAVRVRKWRRRFRVRKHETLKIVDINTAARGPISDAPPVVRIPESKSPLRTLHAALVVIPEPEKGRPFWGAQMLGPNSVVELAGTGISPLTGDRTEIRVRWRDHAGRVTFGYLARTADKWLSPYVDKGVTAPRFVSALQAPLSAWDRVRHAGGQTEGWRIGQWLATFPSPSRVPLFHAAIRELGGKVPASSEPVLAAKLLSRLTNPSHVAATNEDTTMASTKTSKSTKSTKSTKAATPAKSTKAAKPAKASAEEAPALEALTAEPTKPAKASKTAKVPATKADEGKAPAKTKRTATAEPTAQPGRVSQFAGKVIVKLVDSNPRREGTNGYHSFSLIRKNMTYEQFIAAGGRRQDLVWDINKGNAKLISAAKAAKA